MNSAVKDDVIVPNPTFHHPYPNPYVVQIELMKAIYKTLENEYKVGLFESPTGTGKTLSLICSTMTWLRNHKRKYNDGLIAEKLNGIAEGDADDDDEPQWVKDTFKDQIMRDYLLEAKKFEQHLQEVSQQGSTFVFDVTDQMNRGKKGIVKKSLVGRSKRQKETIKEEEIDIESLAPDAYDLTSDRSGNGMDKDVINMLEKLNNSTISKVKVKTSKLNESKVKIFFVSRTHSQLSQFSSQLKMTEFPSSISDDGKERIKYLPMGSRKQLCINENVFKLGDLSSINEKCRELQQNKNDKKCNFMPNFNEEEDVSRSEYLNDLVISDIHDIEDLHNLGKKMKVCPYYSTRKDIPVAEIISLPYQLLLHKDTRNFLGLDLRNSIVVIDEAHNLIDTISRIYSSSISLKELTLVRKGLKNYMKKFMLKMSAGNRISLAKIMKLITGLYKFIGEKSKEGKIKPGIEVSRDEIFALDSSDLLNVYTLEDYFNKSKIVFKLETYMEKTVKIGEKNYKSTQPLLFKIRAFLHSLSNPLKSGKFFFDQSSDGDILLKYLLLDPSEDFKDIVDEAQCVLLAGGTMEPMSDFTDFLVPQVPQERIMSFSCNHVIPESNLNVYPIDTWKNTRFEFSFEHRNDSKVINDLGLGLLDLLSNVPEGAVAFFPSYKYLEQVVKVWKSSHVYEKLESLKPVFIEERSSSVDSVLSNYAHSIQVDKKGAFLLSVVGGKMSEGINFSDELARAVIMIGLPYPNAFSGDLIAKMDYIEKLYIEKGQSLNFAKGKSREFYDNLCMKAINQSVGRAIRNIKDYAVIYLIDTRYRKTNVQAKLSGWIKRRIISEQNDITKVMASSRLFFNRKRC
ncbi:DNA helicase [Martiniozyma asiatica (nom. inval.)]|nr:DNA helicase [Martiniozyma asiatica]